MESVRRCGFLNEIDVIANGSRGGLCLAWKVGAKVNLKSYSNCHIDIVLEEEEVEKVWRFTRFYWSPYMQNRV